VGWVDPISCAHVNKVSCKALGLLQHTVFLCIILAPFQAMYMRSRQVYLVLVIDDESKRGVVYRLIATPINDRGGVMWTAGQAGLFNLCAFVGCASSVFAHLLTCFCICGRENLLFHHANVTAAVLGLGGMA
jgi:hypothetical protein